jgi:hypothetical protein
MCVFCVDVVMIAPFPAVATDGRVGAPLLPLTVAPSARSLIP